MINIPHLETDITQACQLSCVACNHSVPLWRTRKGGPWSADPAQVKRDLNHLATFLHTPLWGALGGEPTLHSQLVDILKIARDSGIADRLEVWTNGLTLQKMKPDFWRAFDVMVLSVYPGKHTDESLAWIRKKCEDEHVSLRIMDEGANPNFMTMLEERPTSPAATVAKFHGCFFKHFSRCASYGFFFMCCCGPHIPMLIQGKDFGADGVKIENVTEMEIAAYLGRWEPLDACTICAGRDTARSIRWEEERNPVVWLGKSGQYANVNRR